MTHWIQTGPRDVFLIKSYTWQVRLSLPFIRVVATYWEAVASVKLCMVPQLLTKQYTPCTWYHIYPIQCLWSAHMLVRSTCHNKVFWTKTSAFRDEPLRTSQTRWKWQHNTFIPSLHVVPFCQLCLVFMFIRGHKMYGCCESIVGSLLSWFLRVPATVMNFFVQETLFWWLVLLGLPTQKFFSQMKEANGLQLSLKQKYYLEIAWKLAESVWL